MAQILVRDLDEKVVESLKSRARERGRSLQAEVKTILSEAAVSPRLDHESTVKHLARLRHKFKGRAFPDSAALIREDRDR